MTERYDAIVVGGGHNGLVCATLLAKSGKSVLLLEAGDVLGGAAITREFAGGCRVSAGAHLLYQLDPLVVKELGLKFDSAADDIATIALSASGQHVRLHGDAIEGVSPGDAAEFRRFMRQTRRFARLLQRRFRSPPPRLGNLDRRDAFRLAGLAFDLRRLGRDDMREFLRVIGMNIYDEIVERFSDPLLRGAVSADATFGTHLGPRSPTTMLTWLYRQSGGGRLGIPKGGLGAVTAEMADRARAAGVDLRTGAVVDSVQVENGRVVGVTTANGDCFDSLLVVSNADPKRTVFELAGARHFETTFLRRMRHLRTRGNVAKLHLALDGLPAVDGLDAGDFGHRLLIAPDEDYVERAFNPAKYGDYSKAPVIEITVPSVHDSGLAPAGTDVLSAAVQYAPYDLRDGWSEANREAFRDCVMTTLEQFLPGLSQRVVASELLLPPDIEREFRITGGHWHHAELALDQFMFVRPVAGAAQYRLPLEGLYVCGAGTHPGGGVSGAAGRNAARSILAKDRPRWL
jgi:phytoene dehydrogenase-like protein